MKHSILFMGLMAGFHFAFAQWSSGSITDPTHREGPVGIGVQSPSFLLDLRNTVDVSYENLLRIRANDAPPGDELKVINSTATAGRFVPALVASHGSSDNQAAIFIGNISSLWDAGNNAVVTFVARADGSSLVNNRPLFEWRNYTTRTMVVTADGNLGIGTTSLPTSRLAVNGAIWIPHAGTTDNESPGIIASKGDDFMYDGEYLNHYGLGFHKFNDGNGFDGTNAYLSGYYGVDVFTGGHSRLRVNNNGNVRIGTGPANANAALTVVDQNNAEVAIWSNQSSSVSQLTFRNNANGRDGGLRYHSNGRLSINLDDHNAAGVETNEYFTILPNGNVGIGSIAPTSKLSVKGIVHAEEVKVDLSVPGPDYVFEKDYPLPTLEEVKRFIDEHKHLPEVPSAKEMEEHGVNVGEMNMILLRKVEELTLYVIEQNILIERLKQHRMSDTATGHIEKLMSCLIEMKEMYDRQNQRINALQKQIDMLHDQK